MPLFRLPPIKYGAQVYTANELSDVIDWGIAGLGIPAHWADTQGEGILIGICDTGRYTHPDIAPPKFSRNFSNSFTDIDLAGHASHCSGIAAALKNGRGVVGVAPKAQIGISKVLGDDGSGEGPGIAAGIRNCIHEKCDIISMSLGGGFDQDIANACQEAVNAGIFLICAAGNEGEEGDNTVGYPAKLGITIAIASYEKDGKISKFSSRGDEVDMAFPGGDILSTWLDDKYRRLSGTSMACPFAAGLVALMLAAHRKAGQPSVRNNKELKEHMRKHSKDMGDPGKDNQWGWGIPDVDGFIRPVNPATPPPVVPPAPPPTTMPPPATTGPGTVPVIPPVPTVPSDSPPLSLFGGMVKILTPFVHNGKQGAFIYLDLTT